EGRRRDPTLVPAGTIGDTHRRGIGAGLLVRLDVRVPDAAAGDARAGREPAGADKPPGRRAPTGLRAGAWHSLGRLGIGVQRPRSRAHLSVLELRNPGPGPEARSRGQPGDRALRD